MAGPGGIGHGGVPRCGQGSGPRALPCPLSVGAFAGGALLLPLPPVFPAPTTASLAAPIGTTLDRYLHQQHSRLPAASANELIQVLRDLALAGKIVNRDVNRAGLAVISSVAGTREALGELQETLDAGAHIRFVRALTNGRATCAVASKEADDLVYTGNDGAPYVVALDPLDGSANIAVNVSIGTIFSVYRRTSPAGRRATRADFLQGGRRQVAAGYLLYGSGTMLVLTLGHGAVGFTYDLSLGEFLLSHPTLTIPADGRVYSCNEGHWYQYPEFVRTFLIRCKERDFSGRYVGSLVADYHRNLFAGGLYLYPPTRHYPDGKPRLLYEAFPLAWLMEQAGGKALAAPGQPLLDVPIRQLDQHTPFYVGSPDLLAELKGGE